MTPLQFLVSLLVSLFLLVPPSVYAEDPIELPKRAVLGTGEWPPYFSSNAVGGGVGCQIVKEAFGRSGVEVEFLFMPWGRALEKSEAGEIDGIAAWGGWRTWAKKHIGSDPVFRGELLFWTRAGERQIDYTKPEQLKGLRVGNLIGESLPAVLVPAEKFNWLEVVQMPTGPQLIKMLYHRRIDAVICNRTAFCADIKKAGYSTDDFLSHPKPFRTSLYRVIFNRLKPESYRLWHAFNVGLDQMHSEGRVKVLLRKYVEGI